MVSKRMAVSALVGCVVASLLWAAPSSADPPTTIWVAGRDTGVPTDCARAGTGSSTSSPTWHNVPYPYTSTQEDIAGRTSVAVCVQKIYDAMLALAADELNLNDQVPVQFRDQLLTGPVDLRSPYQVFLWDTYITLPVLASLSDTAPGATAGVGSCRLTTYVFNIVCKDDGNGRILLRDEYGNPRYGWDGQPLYLYLSGILSQRGGTTYASVMLLPEEGNGAMPTNLVLQHEQVHSQQWARWGWNFGNMYLSEAGGDPGDALWHLWTTGVALDPVCFDTFERAASFSWAGYPCPATWT